MAVAAVGTEGDDDVRPELADDLGHLVHQGGEPGVGEGAVEVVQAAHLRDAEALAGQAQLGLADGGDGTPVADGGVADLARLAAGRRYHHGLGALSGVAGERAPGAECLVVGMSEDTEYAAGPPGGKPSSSRSAAGAGPDRNRAWHRPGITTRVRTGHLGWGTMRM